MSRTDVAINSMTALNTSTALTETKTSAGATGANGYSLTGWTNDSTLRIVLKNWGTATGLFFVQEGGYLNGVAAVEYNAAVGPDQIKVLEIEGSKYRQTDATVDLDIGFTGLMYAFQGVE